jgi:hypothetical protein
MESYALLIAATLSAGTVLAIAALGLLINEPTPKESALYGFISRRKPSSKSQLCLPYPLALPVSTFQSSPTTEDKRSSVATLLEALPACPSRPSQGRHLRVPVMALPPPILRGMSRLRSTALRLAPGVLTGLPCRAGGAGGSGGVRAQGG